MRDEESKNLLIEKDPEINQIYLSHQECETALMEFQGKHYLSEEEELQVKEIKRKKLALKDQMQLIISNYKESQLRN